MRENGVCIKLMNNNDVIGVEYFSTPSELKIKLRTYDLKYPDNKTKLDGGTITVNIGSSTWSYVKSIIKSRFFWTISSISKLIKRTILIG